MTPFFKPKYVDLSWSFSYSNILDFFLFIHYKILEARDLAFPHTCTELSTRRLSTNEFGQMRACCLSSTNKFVYMLLSLKLAFSASFLGSRPQDLTTERCNDNNLPFFWELVLSQELYTDYFFYPLTNSPQANNYYTYFTDQETKNPRS